MSEWKPVQVAFRVASGVGSQAGVNHRPSDSGSDAQENRRETPHGLPLSPEEYERLKSKARYTRTQRTPIAQQDPATAGEE